MGSPTSRHLSPAKAASALGCRVPELDRHPMLHRSHPMPEGQDSVQMHQLALNSLSEPSKCQPCGGKGTVVFQVFENWPPVSGSSTAWWGKGRKARTRMGLFCL